MGFLKGIGLFVLVFIGWIFITTPLVEMRIVPELVGNLGIIAAIVVVFVVGLAGGFKGKPKETPGKQES